jgi:hypothetical protein
MAQRAQERNKIVTQEVPDVKRACLVALVVLSCTTPAVAGKITGSITEGGKPIAKDVKVDVTCGSNTVTAQTDAYGAYSLFVADKGKCTLKLAYQGQAPTFDITSYDGAVQYDLMLEKVDGKYTLKRK